MEDKRYYDKLWKDSFKGLVRPILVGLSFVVVFLLCGCATKTRIEYRDRDVVRYVTKVEKDTVINHTMDSVYYEVFTKGDTVFATKYKEKFIYLDKVQIRRDTCYRDSVVTEYKEQVKEVTKIPKFCYFCIGFSILVIIFAFYKFIRWIQTK